MTPSDYKQVRQAAPYRASARASVQEALKEPFNFAFEPHLSAALSHLEKAAGCYKKLKLDECSRTVYAVAKLNEMKQFSSGTLPEARVNSLRDTIRPTPPEKWMLLLEQVEYSLNQAIKALTPSDGTPSDGHYQLHMKDAERDLVAAAAINNEDLKLPCSGDDLSKIQAALNELESFPSNSERVLLDRLQTLVEEIPIVSDVEESCCRCTMC